MALKTDKSGAVMFRYKNGKTFIYKVPAWLKIMFMLCASLIFMQIQPSLSASITALILIIFLSIFAFLNGFNLQEQIADLKALKYYFVFICALQIVGAVSKLKEFNLSILKPEIYSIVFMLKLIIIMQLCSLLLRSTTAVQIKEGIDLIEMRIRAPLGKIPLLKNIEQNSKYSQVFSLFLNFIPQIPLLWEKLDCAWRSKSGKNGAKKVLVLFPALFSISFQNASNKNNAFLSRQK